MPPPSTARCTAHSRPIASSNLAAGLGWALLTVLAWGPLFPVAKRALPLVDAFALGTVRYAIGGTLLVALLMAVEGRGALRYDGRLAGATLFGVIGIAGFNLCTWIGLIFTTPEHVAVILALQSPLVALAAWLTRGQRPAAFTLGCVALAIAGVLLVVTRGEPARALAELAGGGALLGDLLVLLAALSWATYTLSAARFAAWSPLRFTVLTAIPGGIALVVANVIAVAAGFGAVPTPAALAAVGWQIAYLSVFSVVLGSIAFNAANRLLGPLNIMLMLNLIPVCVFSIEAALGRSFSAAELAGAAMVVGALVANNLYLRGASSSR